MKTLRIFPNTGHQVFTTDLEELLSNRRDPRGIPLPPPSMEELKVFVTLQQPTSQPAASREKYAGRQPWADELPWVLYQ